MSPISFGLCQCNPGKWALNSAGPVSLDSASVILVSGPCIFGLCTVQSWEVGLLSWDSSCAFLVSGPCIFELCQCNPDKRALYFWALPVQSWYALHAWNLPMLFQSKFLYLCLNLGSQSRGCVASVYSTSHISAVEKICFDFADGQYSVFLNSYGLRLFFRTLFVHCAALQICHGFCHATASLGG